MLFKLAWRNIWRNKKRSLITIGSITIAIFLALMMRSMQLGMYKNMIDNIVGSFTGYVQIHGDGYWENRTLDNAIVVDQKLISSLEDTEGVTTLIPRLESYALGSFGDLTKAVMINGIIPDKEKHLQDIKAKIVSGKMFSSINEVVIGEGVANYFKIDIGDTLIFIGQGYHGMSAAGKYSVSGIVDLKNPILNKLNVMMSLVAAQELFSAEGISSSLIVVKEDLADSEKIQAELLTKLDVQKFEVMTWKEMMPEIEQTIVADSVGGLLMVGILYMILTFGIFGTVLMMTQDRLYEFGVLVSIGMKKVKLMFIVLLETIALAFIGIIVGVIFAYPIMLWKHYEPFQFPGDQAEMMENFGFSPEIPFYILPDLVFIHGFLIFMIALVISVYPIVVVWRLNPLKVMKK